MKYPRMYTCMYFSFAELLNKYLEECEERKFIELIELLSCPNLLCTLYLKLSKVGDIVSANPLSFSADVLQFVLETAGYKT